MRVAIFTDTYLPDINGVAKTLGRWVTYLESKGVQVKVFAPIGEPADYLKDQLKVERFYSIPFIMYPECKLAIPNPAYLRKTLEHFNPSLIHIATPFNLGLFGLHYARRNQIPLVASYHTHFDQYLQHYKLQWAEPLLWKYMLWFHQDCSKVYVPSQSTKDHLKNKGINQIEIWSRGVDSSLFQPNVNREQVLRRYAIDPSTYAMLYVGRIASEKSIDVLIQAYEQMPEDMRNRSQLIIAGDGPLLKDLKDKYAGNSRISFLGFIQGQALSELYAASDVFIFPSATETFGNVVLESMACGTPVIGAAAGGVMDNIQHNRNGILCSPGSAGEFAAAAELLFRNETQRKMMGSYARAYSEKQSWHNIMSNLFDSYEEVLRVSHTYSQKQAIGS